MANGSIVDYLKTIGQDSSYAARKKLAAANGISNYSGTAAQNLSLLSTLQKQKNTGSGAGNGKVTPEGASQNVMAGTAAGAANGPLTGSSSGSSSESTGSRTVSPALDFQKSDTTKDYFERLQDWEGDKPGEYEESDHVKDYYDRLQEKEADKPGEFQSKYEEKIDSILDSILNNKEFSYTSEDLANDSLYQMYRENYTRQGDKAMRDAMGNAAALTGGYGSTYASAAGQQAYDDYLANLNDIAMQFAEQAYGRYRDDISERYNQLGAVTGLDNTDYNRYRDTVSDYYTDLNYLAGRYDQEYAKDYGQYQDKLNDYYSYLNHLSGMYDTEYGHDFGEYQQDVQQRQWAEEYAYQQEQAAQAQKNWQAEMDFQREQYEYQKQQAAAAAASRSSSGGSTRKSSGKSKSTKSSSTAGSWAPLSAQLSTKLQKGTITDYDALETVMQEMEKGNLTVDEAHVAIQDAGIDTTAALRTEAQALVPKNIYELRSQKKGR